MSCHLAGSAIAQGPNVGRIDKWSEWKPTPIEPRWLLLSGASDPPRGINISDRRTRDNPIKARSRTFLAGVAHDLANMESAVGINLFNTVKDLYITKSTASGHIRKLFDTCQHEQVKPMLYYTGHGESGTGNWCFADGTISIQEILDMCPEEAHYPMVFSDTCYSGHWANFCLEKNIEGFHCLAACPENSKAIDTKDEGGDLTLYMTGKILRPRTEPLYSGGNREDFPITSGGNRDDVPFTSGCPDYSVKYTELVGRHLANSENILISQSFHNGSFSAIFAPSKRYIPRPAVSWESRSDYDSFMEVVKKNWNPKSGKSKQIYSLACDKKSGFGVLFLTNYGTAQTILTDTSQIDKAMKDGFKITSCAAWGSTFYIIMTKGAREYKKKPQAWFTSNSWDETEKLIQENQKKEKVVTGICYSTGLKKYLVVVMETPQHQTYKKFPLEADLENWVKKQHKEEFHPTIIFKDPTDNKTLIVMIRDRDRSCYTFKYDCM